MLRPDLNHHPGDPAPIQALWICATDFGGADLSIPILSYCCVTQGKRNKFPLPQVALRSVPVHARYGACELPSLFQHGVRITL